MFLRPFCSPSLACAKFPGARLRRLPDERPSSRIPFLVNHPVGRPPGALAREFLAPPTHRPQLVRVAYPRKRFVYVGEKYYILRNVFFIVFYTKSAGNVSRTRRGAQ